MTDIQIGTDYHVTDRSAVVKLIHLGLIKRLQAFHFTTDDIDRLAIVLTDYLAIEQPGSLILARINQQIRGLLLINHGANHANQFLKKLRQSVSLKLTMQFSFFLWVASHQLNQSQTTSVELLVVADNHQGQTIENQLLTFASEQLPPDEHLTLYTSNPSESDDNYYQSLGFKPVNFEEPRQAKHLRNWRHWIFSDHNLKIN